APAAQLALQQRRLAVALLVRAPEADRDAGARLDVLELFGDLGRGAGAGLEAVVGVVAVEDRDLAAGDPALEVAHEDEVGLLLVVDGLQGADELGLPVAERALGRLERGLGAQAAADEPRADAADEEE